MNPQLTKHIRSVTDNLDEDAVGFFEDIDTPPRANANPLADIMIDLETMGTRPDAPIISIGAATFDQRTLTIGETFYINVDLASSVAIGSVIDPDTVMWWMKQSDEARKAVTRKGVHVNVALTEFSGWLDRNSVALKSRKVWACGTDFDCVLLAEHYRKVHMEVPWAFWNQRDYRTIRDIYPNVEPDLRTGQHNALDDAVFQINHLFKIRRTLRAKS